MRILRSELSSPFALAGLCLLLSTLAEPQSQSRNRMAAQKRLRAKNDVARLEMDTLEQNIQFPRPGSAPPGFSAVEIERDLDPALAPARDEDEIGCTSDKTIIERLLKDYKSFKTPSENGVIVWVEVWVQEVNAVNEITSDFDMDIYVTELWMDYALRYDHMNPCKYNLSLNNEELENPGF
ncbi:hypothetical protein L596_015182 [Steinernema carpocapsae]|uniref:Neurotransmitter-gated ion-channel ligand-binding domain-containing protein n=1 Tax=Steinernema carpocapsae TaxID=34508 RepID=A0A4U5NF71_STECR|nr:hypothetical protein L596_015182 [Steinernema carpocapsae]